MSVPNYEGSGDKLHRRMEKLAKREQAQVKAMESKKQQEKKCRDELQGIRKRQQEEKRDRVIEVIENKCRKKRIKGLQKNSRFELRWRKIGNC